MNKLTYGVIKQKANNINYNDYIALKELSFASKNLYNKALYYKRQDFFKIKAIRKSINRSKLSDESKNKLLKSKELRLLPYVDLYHLIKHEPEYNVLNANMSQQILKLVDRNFKAFFALLKLKKTKTYNEKVKLPNYINKDGYFSLIVAEFSLKNGEFILPMKAKDKRRISFTMPNILKDKTIKEIRIIPKQNARFFEVQYVYEKERSNGIYNKNNALAIDLGINNLMTCVTNNGSSFIIDGKKIKSVNQYANKENSRLKSILDKQGYKFSNRIFRLWNKRNNIVNDYILKSCRYIVEFCKSNNVGNIVLGFNKDMTRNISIGKVNNQKVSNLPMGKIKDTLTYMCESENIQLHFQEESYTSKASFWDKDPIKKCDYSGNRVKRGLYKTNNGTLVNADINGALNIMRKSKVVGLEALYCRGEVDTPKRIKLA